MIKILVIIICVICVSAQERQPDLTAAIYEPQYGDLMDELRRMDVTNEEILLRMDSLNASSAWIASNASSLLYESIMQVALLKSINASVVSTAINTSFQVKQLASINASSALTQVDVSRTGPLFEVLGKIELDVSSDGAMYGKMIEIENNLNELVELNRFINKTNAISAERLNLLVETAADQSNYFKEQTELLVAINDTSVKQTELLTDISNSLKDDAFKKKVLDAIEGTKFDLNTPAMQGVQIDFDSCEINPIEPIGSPINCEGMETEEIKQEGVKIRPIRTEL